MDNWSHLALKAISNIGEGNGDGIDCCHRRRFQYSVQQLIICHLSFRGSLLDAGGNFYKQIPNELAREPEHKAEQCSWRSVVARSCFGEADQSSTVVLSSSHTWFNLGSRDSTRAQNAFSQTDALTSIVFSPFKACTSLHTNSYTTPPMSFDDTSLTTIQSPLL
ncbi:hypothetical protein VTI28DRAFT_8299 [Corynascus sepedonium]